MQEAAARAPYPVPSDLSVERASPLLSALYLVFAVLVVARIALNPLLLDLVINYTSDSGSTIEKIHPTLYGFIGVGLTALLCFRVTLSPWEVRVVRAMLVFVGGIALILLATALGGRGGSAGYLIDTYATVAFTLLLFLFPVPWRRRLGHILLGWLVLSALIALVEFGLKVRFLPFDEQEYSFRPIGLAGHPLELGLWTATAISFCAASYWPKAVKIAVTTILVFALAASGARTALIVGLACTFLIAVGSVGHGVSPRKRLERRLVVAAMALAAIPLLLGVLYAAGALERFQGGIADANARARIDIYGVFSYMSWSQFLLGMDPAEMRRIAKVYLDLEFVESSVVIFVTLFGAIGTAFMAALFLYLMRVLLAGAKAATILGTLTFFTIALSSNGLSSKGASVFLLVTLIIAFRPDPAAVSSGVRR